MAESLGHSDTLCPFVTKEYPPSTSCLCGHNARVRADERSKVNHCDAYSPPDAQCECCYRRHELEQAFDDLYAKIKKRYDDDSYCLTDTTRQYPTEFLTRRQSSTDALLWVLTVIKEAQR